MLLEATNRPVRFRFSDGTEVRLKPGEPIDLPDDRARRLLERTAGKVRVVETAPPDESVTIEPADEAARRRPVYWESGGRILGPATVTDFGRAGDQFWLWIEYRGEGRWIRDILLRSQAAWQAQRESRDGEATALSVKASPADARYPIGACIRFDGGLGFVETGKITDHTTWDMYPGQLCYRVRGRYILHSHVLGLEG